MAWLSLLAVQQWRVAVCLLIVANLCSGFSQLEIRRNVVRNAGILALVFAQLSELMVIPKLSPPLVTGISGVAMLIVLGFGLREEKTLPCFYASGAMIVTGIMLISIDVSITRMPGRPHNQTAFDSFIVFAVLNALAGFACTYFPLACISKRYIKIACGIHDVVTTSLVYMSLSHDGDARFLLLLPVSALYGIFLQRSSLRVNSISHHMPISYVVYNIGIWLATPAIQEMAVHGGAMSYIGGAICTVSVVPLLAINPAQAKEA